MMRFLGVLLLIGLTACTSTQEPATYDRSPLPDRVCEGEVLQTSDSEVMAQLDAMPEPVGGMTAIQEQVRYPDTAHALGLQTRIIVVFTVGPDGQPCDVDVAQTVDEEELAGLDEEVREAFYDLQHHAKQAIWRTDFTPGTIDGDPVAVQTTWPITFRIGS